jgi:hypothetical protein
LKSFRERIKFKLKDLKKAADWSLFEKEKILEVLAEYSEWAERLHQIISLILLAQAASGVALLRKFAESKKGEDMRLQRAS